VSLYYFFAVSFAERAGVPENIPRLTVVVVVLL